MTVYLLASLQNHTLKMWLPFVSVWLETKETPYTPKLPYANTLCTARAHKMNISQHQTVDEFIALQLQHTYKWLHRHDETNSNENESDTFGEIWYVFSCEKFSVRRWLSAHHTAQIASPSTSCPHNCMIRWHTERYPTIIHYRKALQLKTNENEKK